MNTLLENYITLKKDPRVSEYDNDDLRKLEKQLAEVIVTSLTP